MFPFLRWCGVAGGILCLLIGIVFLGRGLMIRIAGELVTSEVVAVRKSYSRSRAMGARNPVGEKQVEWWHPQLKLQLAGQSVVVDSSFGFQPGTINVGDKLPVYAQARDGRTMVQPTGIVRNFALPVICVVLGGAMATLGMYLPRLNPDYARK